MKIVESDTDIVNEQVEGFDVDIVSKSVNDTVKEAIEYRKKNVWGTNNGIVDFNYLPHKNELNAIAKDLHSNNRKVAILVDVDVDGYMSAAIIYKAIKSINNKQDIDMLFPDVKLHGIKANVGLVNDEYDYIFCPDSSSNDLQTISKLEKNKRTKVVVIDHHILEHEDYIIDNPGKFLIVSNQYQDSELNKELTGAGMSLLVSELWREDYDIEINFDLAAIGQIADMSDLNDEGVFNIVKKGLSEATNEMLLMFFKDDEEVRSIKHIQFTLIPQINAVSRIGNHEERQLIFNSFIDKGEVMPVSVRHKGGDGKMHTESVDMNVYERANSVLKKVKGRQDRLVKSALKDVEWLSDSDSEYNAIVIGDKFSKGISGLVANKLLGQTKQPSLVFKRNGDRLDGSGRFPENINGLKLLKDIDGVFAAGHEQAFGVGFPEDKFSIVSKVVNVASKQSPDYVYRVDSAYVDELPTIEEIRDIYQESVIFRGAKDEIKLAILGLKVDKKDIVLKNNWTKIKIGGLIINDFNTTDDMKEYINKFGDKCFSFVCSVGFNFWGKEPTPQLNVDKIVKSDGVKVEVTKDNFIF